MQSLFDAMKNDYPELKDQLEVAETYYEDSALWYDSDYDVWQIDEFADRDYNLGLVRSVALVDTLMGKNTEDPFVEEELNDIYNANVIIVTAIIGGRSNTL